MGSSYKGIDCVFDCLVVRGCGLFFGWWFKLFFFYVFVWDESGGSCMWYLGMMGVIVVYKEWLLYDGFFG